MNTREHREKHDEVPLEEVRREAYKLWQQEGRPSGRELDHWLEAKERLRHRLMPLAPADPEKEPEIRPSESLVQRD